MLIELRNVQYAEFASDETPCFTADVFIDGKKVGTARNQGTGGANSIYPHALDDRIEALRLDAAQGR